MGMKRRGTGRRQVLNLNDRQDSPRRTWQTKYQQICAEHSSQNGDSESGAGVQGAISSTSSSKADSNNPLSGLVGPYHSDSETEEEGREAAEELDAKVSDFLKEIQTIAPAKPHAENRTSQMTELVHSADTRSHIQPSSAMAWQECYDENSGYVYYWNMETNAVTWEMPPEYQAYIANTTAMQAQHWMMEQSMGMVPAMPAHHQMMSHAAMIPVVATSVASPRTGVVSKNRTELKPPGTVTESNAVTAAKTSGTKRKRKTAASDSEDERIEMITSYGPASEEESEDEEVALPTRRKKGTFTKTKAHSTSKAAGYVTGPCGHPSMGPELPTESQFVVGPQLQPVECNMNSQTEEQADLETVASSGSQLVFNSGEELMLNADNVTCGTSTLLSNSVPDMGPPGEELEVHDVVEEPRVQKADSLKTDHEEGGYSAPDSSEDKTVTDEAEVLIKPDNSVAECESSVANSAGWTVSRLKMEAVESLDELGTHGSGNTSPLPPTTEEESDESGETDEGVILSRLRSQARVLKELGGEIPDEIRHLIDQSATEAASPSVAEDVIAQIERELPPDYQNSNNKGEENSITNQMKTRQGSSSSAEHSPKPTSFALIAGYGDGSDQEEESSNNCQSKKNKPVKIKKLPSVQSGSNSANLFPIMDYDAQEGGLKEKDVKSVASVSSAEAASDMEVEETSVSGPNESIPSSSKSSEFGGSLFPAINGDGVAPASTESAKPQVSGEHVSSAVTGTGLESNLPDSTTSSKAYKRKIRLEIGAIFPSTSVPKPPTSTEYSTSTTATCSEVKTVQPSATTTTTTTTAASSTVNYSTWTYYNSDPASGERRGFGFQSVAFEDMTESFPADRSANTDTGKPLAQQKKGIINFIKAETINLPKPEEQVSKNVQNAEEEDHVHGEVRAYSKEELETYQHIEELAHLITEKVKFLGEGKDPVSPVQIMAIQIETLTSAWHAGALSQPYLSNWLGDTGAELARLEQAAAPDGWACEWDRTHKRYYYRNIVSEETQWEYPSQPEDVCGGGEAMELCTTPPPPPMSPSVEDDTTPKTPPPPVISQQSVPSPPPPPQISSYREKNSSKHADDKSESGSSHRRKKRKMDGEVTSTSSDTTKDSGAVVSSNFDPSLFSPTASSPTSNPALPPLPPLPPPPPTAPPPPPPPPPPSTPPPPPPPPPSDLPPLPPSTPPLPSSPPPLPRLENEHGEPLPPGVDPPELPYVVARPHIPPVSTSSPGHYQTLSGMAPPPPPPGATPYPPLPPPSPPPRPPDSTDLDNGISMMPEEQVSLGLSQYLMGNAYQASVVSSSSHNTGGGIPSLSMGGPGIEYGPVPYVGAMPMPMPSAHIISRPAAKKSAVSLHAELDSFYSDLASMESSGSVPSGMQENLNELNNPLNLETSLAVGMSAGSTAHDISVQPGPSNFYIQTTSAAVEPEITPAVSRSADSAPVEHQRKKKKPKLAPGLALKKKGVSSLVAKWQQVQQEVRRDYKNLDDDDSDSVSSTHK